MGRFDLDSAGGVVSAISAVVVGRGDGRRVGGGGGGRDGGAMRTGTSDPGHIGSLDPTASIVAVTMKVCNNG